MTLTPTLTPTLRLQGPFFRPPPPWARVSTPPFRGTTGNLKFFSLPRGIILRPQSPYNTHPYPYLCPYPYPMGIPGGGGKGRAGREHTKGNDHSQSGQNPALQRDRDGGHPCGEPNPKGNWRRKAEAIGRGKERPGPIFLGSAPHPMGKRGTRPYWYVLVMPSLRGRGPHRSRGDVILGRLNVGDQ